MPAVTKGKARIYISGGQTGADTAAMRAAAALGMKTGGHLPGGFKKRRYAGAGPHWYAGQKEVPLRGKAGYILRSQRNVDDADVTIALRMHPSCGTDKTIAYAVSHTWPKAKSEGWPVPDDAWETCRPHSDYKPVIVVRAFTAGAVHKVRASLEELDPAVVNVCGNREAGQDYEAQAERFLRQCFEPAPGPSKPLPSSEAKI